MTRKKMIDIILLRDIWELDKDTDVLPNGNYYKNYIRNLLTGQMELDRLGVDKSGNLLPLEDSNRLFVNFGIYEHTNPTEQEKRIDDLVTDIIKEKNKKSNQLMYDMVVDKFNKSSYN